jgi:hypothetical protein
MRGMGLVGNAGLAASSTGRIPTPCPATQASEVESRHWLCVQIGTGSEDGTLRFRRGDGEFHEVLRVRDDAFRPCVKYNSRLAQSQRPEGACL